MATDLQIRPPLRLEPDGEPALAQLKVGVLGCGTVGSEVVRALSDRPPLKLTRVAVAHLDKKRSVDVDPALLTDDASAVVSDPDVDVVVELIGGVDLPHALIREALARGKSVVTANKEVVALHGAELAALALDSGVGFYFEGAVGGAVPMVAAISNALAGDRILGFAGVLNGTSNYVLTAVAKDGVGVADAIEGAQAKGFAEADPTEDLNGSDAARKAAILASLAFRTRVVPDDVFTLGIQDLSLEDVVAAQRLGYETKLLVTAEEYSGFLQVCVEPYAVDRSHPLASVDGSTNTLVVDCDLAHRLVFTGPGAGGAETASAVLGDIYKAMHGLPGPGYAWGDPALRVHSRKDNPGRFVVRCLASTSDVEEIVRECLARRGVGLQRTEQRQAGSGFEFTVVTDLGERHCIQQALAKIEDDDVHCLSLLKVLER